jgi:Ca2+-binding EF-hand superfamily protein
MSNNQRQSPSGQRPLQLSTALLSSPSSSTLPAAMNSVVAGAGIGANSASGPTRSGLLQQYSHSPATLALAGTAGTNAASAGGGGGSGRAVTGGASVVLNATQATGGNSAMQSRSLGPARLKLEELFQHWAQLPQTAALIQRFAAESLALAGQGGPPGSGEPGPSPPVATASVQRRGVVAPPAGDEAHSDGDFEEPEENTASTVMLQPESLSPSIAISGPSGGDKTASPPVGAGTNNPRSHHTTPATQSHAEAAEGGPALRKSTSFERPQQHQYSSTGGVALKVPNVAVSMEDLPEDLGGFSLGSGTSPKSAASAVTMAHGGAPPTTGQPTATSEPSTPNSRTVSAAVRRAQMEGAAVASPRPAGGGLTAMHTPPTRTPRGAGMHLSPHGALVDEMDLAHRLGALSPRALSPSASVPMDGAAGMVGTAGVKSPFDVGLRSPRVPAFTALEGPPKSRSPSPSPQPGLSSGQNRTGSMHGSPILGGGADDSDRELTPRQHSAGGRRRSTNSLGSSIGELPLQGTTKLQVATINDIPKFYFARGRPTNVAPTLLDDVASKNMLAGSASAKEAAMRAKTDEEKEIQALTKIVNQATAAAAAAAASSGATSGKRGSTANGRLSSAKRPTTSGGGPAQPDAAAVVQTAVRSLTTEAFGLPSVLAPVVASKIVRQPGNQLSLANVRSFYDTSIARNSRPRRIFEALLGSNPQAPAIERGSTLGARRNHLVKEDFALLLASLVEHHPGLGFLKEAVDFQSKYVDTVIHRIFFDCDPRDTGKITWEAFANAELPSAIELLAQTDEINHVLAYFSYEHFYVLYCRFWELDSDKDLLINGGDLERYYPEQTANDLVVQRIFAGAGRRLASKVKDRMTYDDFVFFCIAEEDKTSQRAIRYWFRILDTDGDGILSGYELAAFYDITKKRLEQLTGEAIAFPDVMCQIADMLVGPAHDGTAPTGPAPGTNSSSSNAAALVAQLADARQITQRDRDQPSRHSGLAAAAGGGGAPHWFGSHAPSEREARSVAGRIWRRRHVTADAPGAFDASGDAKANRGQQAAAEPQAAVRGVVQEGVRDDSSDPALPRAVDRVVAAGGGGPDDNRFHAQRHAEAPAGGCGGDYDADQRG